MDLGEEFTHAVVHDHRPFETPPVLEHDPRSAGLELSKALELGPSHLENCHDHHARVATRRDRYYIGTVSSSRQAFWQKLPGLVWSNPDAGDDVRIRAALLRPRFLQILDLAEEFGIERVEREWIVLEREATREALRARPIVERVLRNIRRGAERAAGEH